MKEQQAKTTVELVPTTTRIPLVDLGLGADVAIRFPVTGPVVEIMKVNQATGEWAGHMVATVLATKSSKH